MSNKNSKPKSYEDLKKKLNSYGNKKIDNSKKEMYLKQTDRNYKDGDRN